MGEHSATDERDHAAEERAVQDLAKQLQGFLTDIGCSGVEVVGETAHGGAIIGAEYAGWVPVSLSVNVTP